MEDPFTRIKAAADAGNVRLTGVPPLSGLKVIVKLTGFAVGPCTSASSEALPGEKTLLSGTK